MDEKMELLADIFDRDAGLLNEDTQLDTIGWDSMGMLSVIALAKQNGKAITGAQIRSFTTIGDILKAAF